MSLKLKLSVLALTTSIYVAQPRVWLKCHAHPCATRGYLSSEMARTREREWERPPPARAARASSSQPANPETP